MALLIKVSKAVKWNWSTNRNFWSSTDPLAKSHKKTDTRTPRRSARLCELCVRGTPGVSCACDPSTTMEHARELTIQITCIKKLSFGAWQTTTLSQRNAFPENVQWHGFQLNGWLQWLVKKHSAREIDQQAKEPIEMTWPFWKRIQATRGFHVGLAQMSNSGFHQQVKRKFLERDCVYMVPVLGSTAQCK